ncbi:MAG: hypothetical protein ACK4K0_12685 [Flavobacteriales bacterium]
MNKFIIFINLLYLPFLLTGQLNSKNLILSFPVDLNTPPFGTDTVPSFNPETHTVLEYQKNARVYLVQTEVSFCLIKANGSAWLKTTLFDSTYVITNSYRINFDNIGSKELVIEFLKKSEDLNHFITQKTTLLLSLDQGICLAYIPVLVEKTDKKSMVIVQHKEFLATIKANTIKLTLLSNFDHRKNTFEKLIKPLTARYYKQGNQLVLKIPGYKKINKTISAQQIYTLKTGVLLVRLKTNNNKIEAYKKTKKHKESDDLTEKTQKANKEIIQSFKTHFTFCPVYFFMSDDSENVTTLNWSAVNFIDENLLPLPVQPQITSFFIVEFGATDTENGTGMTGLIVKTPDFIQLNKPFPYFSTTVDPMQQRVNTAPAIQKLNAKLVKYHKKVIK